MVPSSDRRAVLKATGTATVVGLAGCVGGTGDGDGRTITTGMLAAETGDLSSVGVPLRDAGLLPRIQVNDADTAVEVDVQVEDSQTDPQAAISGAEALADAGYPAVNGPLTSENTIQVTDQVYRPREVVCCTPGSTSPAITSLEDDDFVFRTISSDAFQGRALAQLAADRIGASSVATIYVNDAYGEALDRTFTESFEDGGGTVGESIAIEKEQSSYSSQLEQAMASEPDALFVVAFPASATQLFRDFYSRYDRDTPILGPDSLRDPELPGTVGESLTNVMGVSSVAAGPGKEHVANLYTEEYGEDPPPFYSYVYDATAILVLANAAAGDNEGPSVREQMRPTANPDGETVTPEGLVDGVEMAADGEEIEYQGASSNVDFDDNGDMRAVNYAVYQYTEDDQIEEIDRIEFEDA
jgi:ABC-type branched-subunit amino acid transport system substrate-binding protein